MASIYSQLNSRRQTKPSETYEGIWQGKTISFSRIFRGHRFTDNECEALCRGEDICIYDLQSGTVAYGVRGRLEEKVTRGVTREFRSVSFRSVEALSVPSATVRAKDVPDVSAANAQDDVVAFPPHSPAAAELLQGLAKDVDVFSDPTDAWTVAALSSAVLPPVKEVSVEDQQVPVYIPVFYSIDEDADDIIDPLEDNIPMALVKQQVVPLEYASPLMTETVYDILCRGDSMYEGASDIEDDDMIPKDDIDESDGDIY